MERNLKADLQKDKDTRGRELPEKTRWGRFKDAVASLEKAVSKRIAVVAISVALAVPCAVSCSSVVSPNDDEKDTASDTGSTNADADMDTDTDADTDMDTDTDTDSDTDTDTDTDVDTDVDTDADTDVDTDVDADSDTDTDTGVDTDTDTELGLPFSIPDAEITIAKERVFDNITINSLDPESVLYDPDGSYAKLLTIRPPPFYQDYPAAIRIGKFPAGEYTFLEVPQGTTISQDFYEGPIITKYLHLYRTYVAEDNADMAFIDEPITLTEDSFVDLGNGIAGTVSIMWKNVSGQYPEDPQYIFSISIEPMDIDGGVGAEGIWHPNTPFTLELGVPVCPANEGRGLTGVIFTECGRPGTLPTERALIEFNGVLFAIVGVSPPGALY